MKPSAVIIAIIATVAIMAFGLIALSAIQAGGWTFLAWILGVAVLSGIAAGLVAFGVRQKERLSEIDYKKRHDQNQFLLDMAKQGLVHPDTGFIARQYAALPEPAQPKPQATDPRHELLIKLCIATLRSTTKYGPTSTKLMSANDAQELRIFADRDKWEKASEYGQDLKYLFTKNGGKKDEQGLLIKQCGNNTVVDLLEALEVKNPILDSAVAALPGISR